MVETEAEKLARMDRKLAESDEKDEKTASLFNPAAFLGLTTETQIVKDEVLGSIKYMHMTTRELLSLREGNLSDEVLSQKMIWFMMNKADSTFTLEQFQKLPHDVSTRLLLALTPKIAFLPQTPTTQIVPSSSVGSGKT